MGDQTLFRHLLVELSISNTAYHVNVTEHVEQKRVTKVVWDEQKKDILKQKSKCEDAVNLLKEATALITYDLEGAIERFTDYLSHISLCVKRIFVVRN